MMLRKKCATVSVVRRISRKVPEVIWLVIKKMHFQPLKWSLHLFRDLVTDFLQVLMTNNLDQAFKVCLRNRIENWFPNPRSMIRYLTNFMKRLFLTKKRNANLLLRCRKRLHLQRNFIEWRWSSVIRKFSCKIESVNKPYNFSHFALVRPRKHKKI